MAPAHRCEKSVDFIIRSTLLIFLLAVLPVNSLLNYQNQIPNGDRVPNPCEPGEIWDAVGHKQPSDGSIATINQFATDFAKAGHAWSSSFCQMDSDGDGLKNGEELGDPDCIWSAAGSSGNDDGGLTHPGICEPLNSARCLSKNTFLNAGNCKFLAATSRNGTRNATTKTTSTMETNPTSRTTTTSARVKRTNPTSTTTTRLPPADNSSSLSSTWDLWRECACYCYNEADCENNHKPGPTNDDDNEENGSGAGHSDDDDDDDDNYFPWPDWSRWHPGRNGGRHRNNSWTPGGRRRGGGSWDGGDFPGGDQGGRRRGGTHWPFGNWWFRGGGGFGLQAEAAGGDQPPLNSTTEFNLPNEYKVQQKCICACPKSQNLRKIPRNKTPK